KLFYHSLDIPIFKAAGYGSSPTYSTDKNITLLSERFKTYKVEGIVTANKNTKLTYGGKASRDTIMIDNIAYRIKDDSVHELLGYYVECYYTEENSRKAKEIIYIDIVYNRNEYITVEA